MKPSFRNPLLRRLALTATITIAATASAFAASATWNVATSGDWSLATNWSAGVPGVSGNTTTTDTAGFGGATNYTTYLAGTRSINTVTFSNTSTTALLGGTTATAANETINLFAGLTINAGSGAVTIGDTASSPTRSVNIRMGSSTIANNSSSPLTIANGFGSRGTGSTTTITLGGSGNTILSGSVGPGAGAALALIKANAGTLTLSGNNSFTGGLAINAGTVTISAATNTFSGGIALSGATAGTRLNLNSTTALGAAASSLSISGGNNASIDNSSAGAITVANNNPQSWSSDFTFVGTRDLNMGTGNITLGGTRQITASASTLTLGGVIADGASTFGLTKAGNGTIVLANANTYDGITTVNAGILRPTNANALGSTTGGTVASAGSIELTAGLTPNSAEALTINGSGTDFSGALRAGTGGGTWAGPIAIGAAGARIGATAGNTLTITGTIADGASNTFAISGQSGTGVVVINPTTANTYTGKTDIVRGILRLGKTDALPTSTMLDVDSASAVADAAVLDLAGFNQTAGGLRDGATSGFSGRITNSVAATTSTLTLNQSEETFYEGTIENGAGIVALVKNGSGTLNLNRANTYTGATSVNAGRLNIGLLSPAGTTLTSPVTVAAGATIGGEGTSSSSLTFGTGTSTLVFNPTTVESLTAASVSTTGATVVITPDSSLASGVTYTVLTNSAGFTGSPSSTYTPSSRGTLAFGGVGNTELQFTAADPVTTLTWKGESASPTLWDINTTANWDDGSGVTTFFDLDSVSFDDSAATTNVVLQPLSVNVGSIAINNPTKPYSFSGGSITGTGDLLKNGGASLTLSNANSFTGGTTLNAGTLNINNPTALGAATAPFIIAGGTIDNTSGSALTTASYPLTLDADLNFSGTNDLNLGAGATNLGSTTATSRTITTTAGTLRLGGVIADGLGGANEIIKSGAGTLTLAGASTYTGQTTISAGTLRLGASSGALSGPLGDTGPGTIVQDGATLDFAGFGVGVESVSIAGTGVGGNGALVNSGGEQTSALRFLTLTANASIGASGNRYDIRGASAASPGLLDMGGFNLTKTGGGYFTIVNTTVTPGVGNIDIVGGTLGLHATNILDGGASNTITIRNGAALDCFQSGTWNAPIWSVLMDAGSTFTSSGGTTGWDSTVTLNGEANLGGSAALTLNGVVSGTSGALTKVGAGNLNLNGTAANTYGGPTTVNAGTLNLGKTVGVNAVPGNITINSGGVSLLAADQIPNASSVALTTATSKFNINGRSETIANLDMQNANSATSEGLVTGAAGKLTITGTLTHTLGNITLNSSGAGNSTEINANTVINNGGSWIFGTTDGTQSLNIGPGGLTIGNGSTIAVGASVAAANFISLGGNVTSTAAATTSTISGAGSLNLNATRTFNVADGAAASDLTIASVIANGAATGGLVKTGLGTQTLASANTYSGATTVSGGTLALGAAGSITNTSAIDIAAGARFETVLQPTYAMPTGRTFTFSLDAADAGSSGQINAAGLDITNGTVAFNITGPLNDPSYVLATYTSRTGAAFASVTPPSGYTLDYAFNGGTQIALVQSATSPYASWGTPFGLTAGSEAGDLDNDGLSNFQEFAFGLSPNSGSSVNPITTQLNKTNGQFTYQRLAGSGLTYSIWTSENLITWTEDTAAIQTPTPAEANESVAVTLSATPKPLTASKLFIQVKAE